MALIPDDATAFTSLPDARSLLPDLAPRHIDVPLNALELNRPVVQLSRLSTPRVYCSVRVGRPASRYVGIIISSHVSRLPFPQVNGLPEGKFQAHDHDVGVAVSFTGLVGGIPYSRNSC